MRQGHFRIVMNGDEENRKIGGKQEDRVGMTAGIARCRCQMPCFHRGYCVPRVADLLVTLYCSIFFKGE